MGGAGGPFDSGKNPQSDAKKAIGATVIVLRVLALRVRSAMELDTLIISIVP